MISLYKIFFQVIQVFLQLQQMVSLLPTSFDIYSLCRFTLTELLLLSVDRDKVHTTNSTNRIHNFCMNTTD